MSSIEQNQQKLKRDIRDLKTIFYDVPMSLLKPLVKRSIRQSKNNIKTFIKVIENATDDINPLDLIPVIVESAPQEIKIIKKWGKEMKKEIKNLKSKEQKKDTKFSGSKSSGGRSRSRNHPEWYLNYPKLCNNLVGINISTRSNALDGVVKYQATAENQILPPINVGVASCAALNFEFTIPKTITNDWNQGINTLFRNIWSANAGTPPFSAGQLANYVLTVRAIDAYLSLLARAIKCLNNSQFYDAQSPRMYYAAMGLDYDSFVMNAANARELYNRLATIRFTGIPLNIDLFDRTRWLCGNMFADSDDVKAQIYIPTTDRIYYFLGDNTPKVVRFADMSDTQTTTGRGYEDIERYITTLFNDFQSDAVFQDIAAAILKAYQQDALVRLPMLDLNASIEPVFDLPILTQIQNASLAVSGEISQSFNTDGDFVTSRVYEELNQSVNYVNVPVDTRIATVLDQYLINPIYNSNVDVVDPGKVLSSTRFMTSRHAVNAPTNSDNAYIEYDTYGTEIVHNITVLYVRSDSQAEANISRLRTDMFVRVAAFVNNEVGDYALAIPTWTWFDYFPLVVPYLVDADVKQYRYNIPMFDFNNYGVVSKRSLDSYGAIATLSLLYTEFKVKVNRTEVIDI